MEEKKGGSSGMIGVKRKAEDLEKTAEVAADQGGSKRPTETPKKKTGGGGGSGKAKVAKKQIPVVPDDNYDDKDFDLQRLMEMQSRQVRTLEPWPMIRRFGRLWSLMVAYGCSNYVGLATWT